MSCAVPHHSPELFAYAVIGFGGRILLVRRNGRWTLPGGPVRFGQPVERSLAGTLREQLGVTAKAMYFVAAAEHGEEDPAGTHQVALAFDFEPDRLELVDLDHRVEYRWVDQCGELGQVDLYPAELRTALGYVAACDEPWAPWRKP